MAVRKADALRAAMERLLAGKPIRIKDSWDGKRTWENVRKEADVPRSTAARARDVIKEWEDRTGQATIPAKETSSDIPHPTQPSPHETNRNLRETVRILANHVQALTIALEDRERIIESLRTQLQGSANVEIFPRRNRAHINSSKN